MKPDCTKLSTEDLKRLLHNEHYKFSQGIDKGMPFDKLKEIRLFINLINQELEKRLANGEN